MPTDVFMAGVLTGALIAIACVIAFAEGRYKGRSEFKPPVADAGREQE